MMSEDNKKELIKDLETTTEKSPILDSSEKDAVVNSIKKHLKDFSQGQNKWDDDTKFILMFALVLLNGFLIFMLINLL